LRPNQYKEWQDVNLSKAKKDGNTSRILIATTICFIVTIHLRARSQIWPGRVLNGRAFICDDMLNEVHNVAERRATMGAIPRSIDILHLSDYGLHLLLGQGRANHYATSTSSRRKHGNGLGKANN
jgi:hypothetical protein